ncbi:MAG: response regulator [Cyanobacteria bacterium P01_F01_bin.53]
MRILLIEDDEILMGALQKSLQAQRYTVDTVDDGQFGLEYAESGSYDVLLIDVGLPRLDGISLCQQLRNNGYTTPILLMTAKDAPDEKIRGLDAGADDYLTKPLDIAELHARLRALLRRGEVSPTSVLEIGPLRLNPVSCEVTYHESPLKLTPKEYSLLELLLRNPNRVFSRGNIIEHLWTFDDPPLEDSVKAHVKGLRRRLKKAGAGGWIENVYGLGYKLTPKLEDEPSVVSKQATETTETTKSNSTSQSSTQGSNSQQANTQDTGAQNAGSQDSVEEEFHRAMAGLWQQHRGAIAQRLTHIQTAATALTTQQLTEETAQAAAQAAHKLAGVLGMFGQDDGTQVARELETLFSSHSTSARTSNTQPTAKVISPLVLQLSEILETAEKSLGNIQATPPTPTGSTQKTESSRGPASQAKEPAVPGKPSIAPGTAYNILAVDDDPIFLSTLSPMLEPWGMTLTTLTDPTKFWDTLTDTRPDLLILDIEMPQVNGIELCEAIRNDERDQGQWQSLPILFLTSRENAAGEVFSAGADDYVVKPVVGPELITRISNRLERTRLLKTLSSREPLTGLMNQAHAHNLLMDLISREQSHSFVLIQLANLQAINLEHGHRAGHQVLKAWGEAIAQHMPNELSSDWASYWGNGEFVLVLPDVDKEEVSEAIAPLLKAFRQRIFTTSSTGSDAEGSAHRFQAQYALGLSAFPNNDSTPKALYQSAHTSLKTK